MTSLDLLSKCVRIMELRFDAMLYCNLVNDDEGHIKCSRGPQVPHPCSTAMRKCRNCMFEILQPTHASLSDICYLF